MLEVGASFLFIQDYLIQKKKENTLWLHCFCLMSTNCGSVTIKDVTLDVSGVVKMFLDRHYSKCGFRIIAGI